MARLLPFFILLASVSCQKDLEEPLITENTLHYDGPNQNAPVLARGISYPSVKFTATYLNDHGQVGKRIREIDYHLSQKPQNLKLLIFAWNPADDSIPGDLLYEKEVNDSKRNSWNKHPLEINLEVPGQGLWITFEVDSGDNDLRVIGCDPGPGEVNGDIYGIFGGNNPGWIDFYQFSGEETNINWNIRAMLE